MTKSLTASLIWMQTSETVMRRNALGLRPWLRFLKPRRTSNTVITRSVQTELKSHWLFLGDSNNSSIMMLLMANRHLKNKARSNKLRKKSSPQRKSETLSRRCFGNGDAQMSSMRCSSTLLKQSKKRKKLARRTSHLNLLRKAASRSSTRWARASKLGTW